MVASHFTGPVMSGDLTQGQTGGPNQGFAVLEQDIDVVYTQTGAAGNTDIQLNVPAGSIITDFILDLLTAWATTASAVLLVGNVQGGNQYVSSTDIKTGPAGRMAITYTAAQLAAMAGVTTAGAAAPIAGPVWVRITLGAGAATAGALHLIVRYAQQTSSN